MKIERLTNNGILCIYLGELYIKGIKDHLYKVQAIATSIDQANRIIEESLKSEDSSYHLSVIDTNQENTFIVLAGKTDLGSDAMTSYWKIDDMTITPQRHFI